MSTPSTVIKLNCIPYGFFETQLLQYFRQFGTVKRVHVARNKKTGNHRGWAYVQFTDRDVAQLAAEAMDGYLMFEKKLKCKVLLEENVPEVMKKEGKPIKKPIVKGLTKTKHMKALNKEKTEKQEKKAKRLRNKKLSLTMKGLVNMGIEYDFGNGTEKKFVPKEDTSEVMEIEPDVVSSKSPASHAPTPVTMTPAPKKRKTVEVTPKTPAGVTPPLRLRLRSAKKPR